MTCSLKKNSIYILAHDDIRSWVPWFDISDPDISIKRPSLGDVLVYLGRGSEVVKGRGPDASPDSWCFLYGCTIAEVYNNTVLQCIDEIHE